MPRQVSPIHDADEVTARDVGAGKHAHGFRKSDALFDGLALDLAKLSERSAQPLRIDLDPTPAHQGKPIGLTRAVPEPQPLSAFRHRGLLPNGNREAHPVPAPMAACRRQSPSLAGAEDGSLAMSPACARLHRRFPIAVRRAEAARLARASTARDGKSLPHPPSPLARGSSRAARCTGRRRESRRSRTPRPHTHARRGRAEDVAALASGRVSRRVGGKKGERRRFVFAVFRKVEMHAADQVPSRIAPFQEFLNSTARFRQFVRKCLIELLPKSA